MQPRTNNCRSNAAKVEYKNKIKYNPVACCKFPAAARLLPFSSWGSFSSEKPCIKKEILLLNVFLCFRLHWCLKFRQMFSLPVIRHLMIYVAEAVSRTLRERREGISEKEDLLATSLFLTFCHSAGQAGGLCLRTKIFDFGCNATRRRVEKVGCVAINKCNDSFASTSSSCPASLATSAPRRHFLWPPPPGTMAENRNAPTNNT